MAHALAKIMRQLDDAKYSRVEPRDFKSTIGRYDQAFRGFEQQDAHEFISKVMEGMGDDLNRIPIVSGPQGHAKPPSCKGSLQLPGGRNLQL